MVATTSTAVERAGATSVSRVDSSPYSGRNDGLSWLLAPVSLDRFTAANWGKSPLRIQRGHRGYFRELLDGDEADFMVFAACRAPGMVDILLPGEKLETCRGQDQAAEALRAGKSLRLEGAQRLSRPLTVLCRAIEREVSCPVAVNVYISPRGGRALGRHYDTHDVFVLQLRGRKRWRIFDSPVPDPIEYLPPLRSEPERRGRSARVERGRDLEAKDRCKLVDEFVLEEGDSLYVPRGFLHEAEAEPDCASWHFTVGIHAITYADLLAVAIGEVALQYPPLRRSLPLGFATYADAGREVCRELTQLSSAAFERLDAGAALEQTAAAFFSSREPIPAIAAELGGSRPGDALALDSKLCMRPGLLCRVAANAGDGVTRVALEFGGTRVSLPAAFEPACRVIARGNVFVAALLPGEITDEERLSLAQKLANDGLLVPCGAGETG